MVAATQKITAVFSIAKSILRFILLLKSVIKLIRPAAVNRDNPDVTRAP